jgi:ComF family protein
MKLRRMDLFYTKAVSEILDWLFPKKCYGCGKIGKYFCSKCRKKTEIMAINYSEDGLLDGKLAVFKYDGLIKKAISDLKYNLVTDIIEELSGIMAGVLRKNFPNILNFWRQEKYVLVPIPLFWQRQNWRGFYQAEDVGQALAKKLRLRFNKQILYRVKKTAPQVSFKDKQQRRQGVKGVFQARSEKLADNLILFDDVSTTGSTLNEAVKTVKAAGAKSVWGLTIGG